MTGASFSRRAARLFLVAVISLASLLGTQVRLASPAAAAPDGAVMRPTTVSMRADEIVTVDVLSNDDPPAGATWNRSSVCLVLAAGCLKQSSVDGFSWSVDAQGTLRYFQTPRFGGVAGIEYQVKDSRGTAWRSRLDLKTGLTAHGSETPPADGPRPRLKVTQAVSPTTFDHAGQVLTWTSVVTNFGDVPLPVKVTDDSSTVSARSCAPVANLGTLAPGASTTCTATSTIRQDYVDGRNDRTDAVRVGAASAADGQRYRTSASATATSTPVQNPGLSLTATASPTTISKAAQAVAYTFGVRNRGNVTLRDLVVTAPFPGLSALVCAPVPLGQALAPAQTTTCRATRTTAIPDLTKTALTDTAKATARTSTKVVSAAAAVKVAVKALPPVATDDTVPAVDHGPDVFLPGATNDRSGEPGGPAIDPARTVFVAGPDHEAVGQRYTTPEGTWSILPDGSVRFRIGPNVEGGQVGEVAYRVYDTAGHSAVGQLQVPVRTGPRTASTEVHTPQGQPVTVDVLGKDNPGQNPDGSPSAFDRSSIRVASVSGSLLTSFTTDQKSVTVTGVGTYLIGSDARITFTPTAGYFGFGPTLVYTARSTAGATLTGTLKVDVDRNGPFPPPVTSGPVASDDAAITTTQLTVPLPAQANDFPGSHGLSDAGPVFPADQLAQLPATSAVRAEGRELYVPRQGVYRVSAGDTEVFFTPARGGSLGDMTPVVYEIRDTAGATSRAHLRVTVLAGPVARPEYVGTRQNQTVTVDVYANDDPGTNPAGGTPTHTDGFPFLTTVGLPGATTSPDQHTLTVPGQGVYTVNPGNGAITFDPETGFTGVASEIDFSVGYTVERAQLPPATVDLASSLRVTVRADTPVARADTVTTHVGQPVVVAVLGNDAAGSSATPLVGSSVRLRLTPDLPKGSTLYGDTKTLVVPEGQPGPLTPAPGGGVFLVSGRGEITFVPIGAEPAPPLTIGYQVADANGTTARSTLTVTVSR